MWRSKPADLAGSGQSAIANMEATMRQIMEASGAVTAKLAVLSEKTANINSVVTTITKVADQTNLLSLNAAIEAEKAGEYGLGFAVVAMEIRRLADQTAVATYDIEKMVKEMQSAVAAGVMGMDKFSDEVRRGVEEVRQVSAHLAQIIDQVQLLTPRFQMVNEGMHAQASGAQQISDTMEATGRCGRQDRRAAETIPRSHRTAQLGIPRPAGQRFAFPRWRTRQPSEPMLFLLFKIGGDRYAIEATRVLEVVPLLELKRLPHPLEGVTGVFNYRGQPVPAVDLSYITTGVPAAERLSTRIIVVNHEPATGKPQPVGLIAEQATETLQCNSSDFAERQAPPGAAPYLGPILPHERGSVQWVYEQRLLPEPVRQQLFRAVGAAG